MSAAERDYFLVIEAHTVEDLETFMLIGGLHGASVKAHISEMVRSLRGIWETTIRRNLCLESINSARSPWYLRTAHFLDGSNTSQSPKISVADPWELLLDLLHKITGHVQTGVGVVKGFGGEAHRGVITIVGRELIKHSEEVGIGNAHLPPVLLVTS